MERVRIPDMKNLLEKRHFDIDFPEPNVLVVKSRRYPQTMVSIRDTAEEPVTLSRVANAFATLSFHLAMSEMDREP